MSREYDEYLDKHVAAVKDCAEWMVKNLSVVNELSHNEKKLFRRNVENHDKSKYEVDEYLAYDHYFYGTKDIDAFNRAWLHHIHHNPHHWQHWMLMNDDGKYREPGKVVALEMPKIFALEMVADWWSFSWRKGDLHEVFDWYEKHRECIVLHDKARAYVERVLDEMREKV